LTNNLENFQKENETKAENIIQKHEVFKLQLVKVNLKQTFLLNADTNQFDSQWRENPLMTRSFLRNFSLLNFKDRLEIISKTFVHRVKMAF